MSFELQFLEWLQTFHTPFLDTCMIFITSLGNAGLFWILLSVLFLLFPRTRLTGACMLFAMALGLLIGNLILKPSIARVRPYEVAGFTRLLIDKPVDYSFPSGHTQASFASAWVFFAFHKKTGAVALLLATLIAFSRMYLFVHYPTDILAGFLLGSLFAFIAVRFMSPVLKKRFAFFR